MASALQPDLDVVSSWESCFLSRLQIPWCIFPVTFASPRARLPSPLWTWARTVPTGSWHSWECPEMRPKSTNHILIMLLLILYQTEHWGGSGFILSLHFQVTCLATTALQNYTLQTPSSACWGAFSLCSMTLALILFESATSFSITSQKCSWASPNLSFSNSR